MTSPEWYAELVLRGLGTGATLSEALAAADVAVEMEPEAPAAFGMVGDEWHGPKPPGPGWVEAGKGPKGGKVWRKAESTPETEETPVSPEAAKASKDIFQAMRRGDTAAALQIWKGLKGAFKGEVVEALGEENVRKVVEASLASRQPPAPPATPPTTPAQVSEAAASNPVVAQAVGGVDKGAMLAALARLPRVAGRAEDTVHHGFPYEKGMPVHSGPQRHYEAELERAPVVSLPVRDLIAMQAGVSQQIMRQKIEKGEDRPSVVIRAPGGKLYLWDGTHAATLKKLAGQTHAPAKLLDYDPATKRATAASGAALALEEAFQSEPPGPGWIFSGNGRWVRGVKNPKEAAPEDEAPPDDGRPTVAVIGGGPGGLFASYVINQRLPQAHVTLFEAQARLGGKVFTDTFSDGTPFEAGVAELYEYKSPPGSTDRDPLRQLIEEDLALPTGNMVGGGVVLGEKAIRDYDHLGELFGNATKDAVLAFHRRCSELLPLEQFSHRWQPSNDHPWADRPFRDCVREEIGHDPDAVRYVEVAVHSDLATEPRTCNGLNGLKNVLLDNDEYMQLYHVVGGIGRVPEALAAKLKARVLLEAHVASVEKAGEKYRVRYRRGGEDRQADFDAVVLALPNHWLSQVRFSGQKLNEAVHAVLEHYDLPAHYLRVSFLFDAPWWEKHRLPGDFWMWDGPGGGGCCVYNESHRWRSTRGHVLSLLLAGQDALVLRSANEDDQAIVKRVLESFPRFMRDDALKHFVEGRIDSYVGSINAQPGGLPVPELRGEHQPEPEDHPGVLIVGDFLFDSTLNAALVSASTAVDLLVDYLGVESKRGSAAVRSVTDDSRDM